MSKPLPQITTEIGAKRAFATVIDEIGEQRTRGQLLMFYQLSPGTISQSSGNAPWGIATTI